MRYKTSLALLLGVSLMTSCQSQSVYADFLLRTPDQPMLFDGNDINAQEFQTFLGKINAFAANFVAGFHDEFSVNENSAISPLSLYMALALVVESSSGPTQTEILTALDMDITQIRTYTPLLYALANQIHQKVDADGDLITNGLIDLSNSIWFDEQITLKDAALDILAADYNAFPFAVDFLNDNAEANKAIRGFIKEKTRGLIDQDFQLDQSTLIALINTLYVKDVWNDFGGDLDFTNQSHTFQMIDKQEKTLPFLQGYYIPGNIYRGENYQSFYTSTTNGYQLKFILPDEDVALNDLLISETFQTVNAIRDYQAENNETMERMNTRILFPEFDAESENDVKPVLKNAFNINTLFTAKCDFTPLSEASMYCEKVIHKTKLTVDKTGIEGAAVTIVQMCNTSAPVETYTDVYQDFIIDRAFAYILTDQYHVPLFSGVVQVI
ncbi:MAG: serpin family protein [Bacilli bacterium]|nr:serpin family protein [Bacilli bacterium]